MVRSAARGGPVERALDHDAGVFGSWRSGSSAEVMAHWCASWSCVGVEIAVAHGQDAVLRFVAPQRIRQIADVRRRHHHQVTPDEIEALAGHHRLEAILEVRKVQLVIAQVAMSRASG